MPESNKSGKNLEWIVKILRFTETILMKCTGKWKEMMQKRSVTLLWRLHDYLELIWGNVLKENKKLEKSLEVNCEKTRFRRN